MTLKRKKTIATILIIIVSVSAFIAFMFIQVNNEKAVHAYTGILFGIFPAIAILLSLPIIYMYKLTGKELQRQRRTLS